MRGFVIGRAAIFICLWLCLLGVTELSAQTAVFVKLDTVAQGTWKPSYGLDGYNVIGDTISYPAYATVTPSGQTQYVWAASTTDVRALQKAVATDRIAATWYSSTGFTVDINLTDGQTHQVAVYCLDWDNLGRGQTVNILNTQTQAVLDSRSVTGFTNGQYLVWNLSGHVAINVSRTAGQNAVISGIFFGASSWPTISSLSPTSGSIGTPITINGSNFSSGGTVKFNGIVATTTSWSTTKIVAVVPNGASAGLVTVTVGSNTSTGVQFSVIPNITNLSPSSGATGTVVAAYGAAFGTTQGLSTISFNGVAATATSWANTKVIATVPATSSSGPVVITVGGSASNGPQFTVTITGTISGKVVRASDGSAIAGASVSCYVQGLLTSSASDGSYSLSGLPPGNYTLNISATGFSTITTPLIAVNSGGVTTQNVSMVTPRITAISPVSGPVGTTVVVSGSSFGPSSGAITFNGTSATPTVWGSDSITTIVPTGATTGSVVVTVGGAASNAVSFTVGTGTIAGAVTRASDSTAISGASISAYQAG